MSNLDLTIVVPTYNLGHYLPETLKSIQQQTIDFELWLIDDASTDGTAQTVADFVKGIPNFHATGFNHHRGIGAARNFGIDHATGQAVAFVDGDNLIAPTFAATLSHGFTSGVVATAVGYDWWHRNRGGPNRFQLLSQREMFDQVSRHGSEVGGYIWNKAFSRDALTAGNMMNNYALLRTITSRRILSRIRLANMLIIQPFCTRRLIARIARCTIFLGLIAVRKTRFLSGSIACASSSNSRSDDPKQNTRG